MYNICHQQFTNSKIDMPCMRLTIFVQPSNRCKVATKFQSAIFSTCQNHRCDWRSQMEEVDISSIEKSYCQSFYLSATAVKIPERRNQTLEGNAATRVDVQGWLQSGTLVYIQGSLLDSRVTRVDVFVHSQGSLVLCHSCTLVLWYRGLCLTWQE